MSIVYDWCRTYVKYCVAHVWNGYWGCRGEDHCASLSMMHDSQLSIVPRNRKRFAQNVEVERSAGLVENLSWAWSKFRWAGRWSPTVR